MVFTKRLSTVRQLIDERMEGYLKQLNILHRVIRPLYVITRGGCCVTMLCLQSLKFNPLFVLKQNRLLCL